VTSTNQPHTVINERYALSRRIGRGGMADVFLGHDRQLNRPVAIKVLFPEFAVDPNFVERFRREAQAAANLNHPNIVDVFDWGKHGGTYFIAMEYVEGRTLADILRAQGQLTSKQAAEVAGEVAAALGYAHAAGLVHRDIKPANILVGTNGAVKVADFGIARALNSSSEQNLTQAGAVMGTATYFSPEQAQGAQPDPRSDLYSLGVVMYEMIAGRPPFTGENPVAIAYKQVHDYPRPLNELVMDVPRAFEAIVAKLLTKDPNVRYSTADALREDLRRFRNGEMPVALMSAASRSSTAQTPTVVGGAVPRRGGPADPRASQQMTAVQRSQSGGPPSRATAGRPGQRPPTGAVPVGAYERNGRTGWYALAAFFALVALAIGGFLLFKTLSHNDEPASDALPDYTGVALETAIADIVGRGWAYKPVEDPDATVEPGSVSRTDPAARTVVPAGYTIEVYYRASEQTAAVPDVSGETIDDARRILGDAGFGNVTVRTETGSDVESGRVIRTEPGAGTDLVVTDGIVIVASAGPPGGGGESTTTTAGANATTTVPAVEQVAVPYVIGDSESEARSKLTAAGFDVEVALFDGYQAVVLDQSPRRGTMADRGSTVTINVGRGIATTTRPPTQTTSPPAATTTTSPPAATTTTTVAPETTTTTVPPGP